MKTSRVTVRFVRGLHARPAASLVRLFRAFRSRVVLRLDNRVAHAGSFLSILLLSATLNTQLEIQAMGEDEEAAIRAAEAFFQTDDEDVARQIHIGALPSHSSTNAS
jgi:phosphocarrier protein